MKKLGKSLLVASLLTGVANATGSTNKTFFSGRPVGVNLAMEGTTWHTQINRVTDPKDPFDSAWQITGFYQENTNKDSLGKYFGFQNKNVLVVGEAGTSTDVSHKHLYHDPTSNGAQSIISSAVNGTAKFTGTLNLEYQHEAAGVRIDYQQDLDHFMKGLYCKVRAPIVWQKSGVNLGLTNSVTATANLIGSSSASDTTVVSIADYFNGTLSNTAGFPIGAFDAAQSALQFAKIDGTQDSAGLADVDVLVGWSFKETESSHAGGNIGITIPTSQTPDGRFLGQTSYGNNGHWAIGAGVDATMRLWEGDGSFIDVNYVTDWRYLFENVEVRTLGLKNHNGESIDWGQYLLGGRTNTQNVFPMANVTTQQVVVYPGHQLDTRLGLVYRNGNFTFDIGYNVYKKESEYIALKCSNLSDNIGFVSPTFNDLNIANTDKVTNPTIGENTVVFAGAAGPDISLLNLDVEPARTPSQTTHKIYGGLGYAFEDWKAPTMLGLGASYEGHTSQAGLDNWSIWGKIGLSF